MLTGLPPQQRDALIAALMTPHDQQREMSLDKRRGHRPRLIAPGVGRRPVLTLADRLLATILHQRLALPQTAIAALSGVRPETVNKRIRDIRQLLDQAGYTIQPGPHRLASLEDLSNLAAAEGILAPAEIKTVMGLTARGSRETWAGGLLQVVTGRRCWRQVCCPCAGRRRDRFPGCRMMTVMSSREHSGFR